jgi:hypothetical protein
VHETTTTTTTEQNRTEQNRTEHRKVRNYATDHIKQAGKPESMVR